MKLCFSTLGCFDRELERIVSLANEYGISALEIRGIGGVLDNTQISAFSEESADATVSLLASGNVTPIVLGTSCSFHNPEKYERAISEGIASIKIAERLNIPNIRVFGDRMTEGSTERIISGISELCSASGRVNVLLEVHGDYNTLDTLMPVVNGLSELENFGIIWDIEHTHKTYGDGWEQFYSALRPYIKHVHIKDYSDDAGCLTLIGYGSVAIVPIVRGLIENGYDGYFSLEWEKKWHPELPDIEEALESFIKVMKEAEA